MKRTYVLSLFVVCAGMAALLTTKVESQTGLLKQDVALQGSTPGFSQSGHANISGTMIAGQFQGGGAGLVGMSAANISTGILPDARLSPNVAFLSGIQSFTGMKTFAVAPNFTAAGAPFTVSNTTLVANLNADRLDGLDSSAFLTSVPNPLDINGSQLSSFIIRGTNASNGPASSGVYGVSSGTTGTTYAGRFDNFSSGGTAIYGTSVGPTGIFAASNISSGSAYGGFFRSSSSSGTGVLGQSISATGTVYGGRFLTQSPNGIGASGYSTSTTGPTYGGHFQVDSTQGVATYGLATAATGTTYGGYFESASASGRAVYGFASAISGTNHAGYFDTDSVNGTGIYAHSPGPNAIFASNTATTGITYGGRFTNSSTSGRAVSGFASATSGTSYGGHFQSDSPVGVALYALASAASGISYAALFESSSINGNGVWIDIDGPIGLYSIARYTSGNTYGGYFLSQGSAGRGIFSRATDTGATNTPYGVYGQASTLTTGYGLYASGDSGASGTKSFRIDHPHDPENKYLLHYSSESPFPQNFYNGNVTTDAKGYAWVDLPDYFGDINTNFKYQLTVLSEDFVQAVVSKKIAGNRFQIRTSAPNTEVSWEVKADRNDERIRFNRPTDVRIKSESERGKYQHPEYYGLGPERGLDFEPRAEAARSRSKK